MKNNKSNYTNKKIQLGQFFTVDNTWLTEPVVDFINLNIQKTKMVIDPFAGGGIY